jgi:hypothetical protein
VGQEQPSPAAINAAREARAPVIRVSFVSPIMLRGNEAELEAKLLSPDRSTYEGVRNMPRVFEDGCKRIGETPDR